MRIAITGATGNVGTSLLRHLVDDPRISSIVGIARREPQIEVPKTTWVAADVSRDELVPHFRGTDVVVHLAWLIQPSRDERTLYETNVAGSRRVFAATAAAGVPALVYASSVGAYSPGPKDRAVDESWPTDGVATSFYSRHKAEVEHVLDGFEERHGWDVRTVRLRPALTFKREAASGVRRLFAGPFLPSPLLRRSLIPVIPYTKDLVFQAVHSKDVAEAYHLAITGDVRGAFNIAADPILDAVALAEVFDARPLRVPRAFLRAATTATWRMRLQPTPPGWVDLALQSPLLDTARARTVLWWEPRVTATQALADLLSGIRDGAGLNTPPLHPKTGGPLRVGEIASGVGRRTG
ncbi:MAG: NAD-dependent epimerase/dehydratase family protein [Actinomycetota bacterium]